jgi:hypothetical protein
LAVPSVSLSFGLNPVDETIVSRLHSNVPLDARGIDPAFLAVTIERVLAMNGTDGTRRPSDLYRDSSAAAVAREIMLVVGAT